MQQHHTKLQNGGRIVVPAAFRQAMNLSEGEEVILRLEEDGLHIYSARQALQRARSVVGKYVSRKTLAEELISDRRKEAKDE